MMRSISCACISFVIMYTTIHMRGSDRLHTTIKGAFIVGAFAFLLAAVLFMIFGL